MVLLYNNLLLILLFLHIACGLFEYLTKQTNTANKFGYHDIQIAAHKLSLYLLLGLYLHLIWSTLFIASLTLEAFVLRKTPHKLSVYSTNQSLLNVTLC